MVDDWLCVLAGIHVFYLLEKCLIYVYGEITVLNIRYIVCKQIALIDTTTKLTIIIIPCIE